MGKVRLLKTKIELTKKQKFLIAAGTGMLLLVILWPVSGNSKKEGYALSEGQDTQDSHKTGIGSGTDSESLEVYVERQEKRLKQVLSEIDGVGEVEVMITARASRELVIEKDVTTDMSVSEEADGSGGRRTTKNSTSGEVSVMNQSGSQTSPYVVKSLVPELAGVAVAAKGAGESEIETEIIHTVQALFDVPVHKIKVVKMK